MRIPVQRLLLAPLVLWAAHASTSFALVDAHCRRGAIDGELGGFSTIRLILLAATVAAAVAIAVNGLAAARAWLATTKGGGDPTGARAHVLLTSTVMSGVALLYLVWAVVFATEANLCR
jgi:hypothetical protein